MTSLIKAGLSEDDMKILRQNQIIPDGATQAQVEFFMKLAKVKGLSPFEGQVRMIPFWNKDKGRNDYATITTRDGFRAIAARAGMAGNEPTKYNLKSDGTYKTEAELKASKERPLTATVTVYKLIGGQRVPYTATAAWDEFAQTKKDGSFVQKWQSMPTHMLEKCAETKALRQAWPEEFSGLYEESELGAFQDAVPAAIGSKEDDIDRLEIMEQIKQLADECVNVDDLGNLFRSNPTWKQDAEIIAIFQDRKTQINAGLI